MNTNQTSPIFVCGTPRSGTTLLAKIIGQHDVIFMPGETHFFDDIYARKNEIGPPTTSEAKSTIIDRLRTLYQRYDELVDQERIDKLFSIPSTASQLHKCNSYCEMFSTFMELQLSVEGKLQWGNNAPRDLFSFKEILSFYPNAKFVVCIRDIRDFLLSYKGKWQIASKEHVDRLKTLYHPIVSSILWKSSMRLLPQIQKVVRKENFLCIKYEELVTDPKSRIEAICQMVGVEFQPQMLNISQHNSSTQGKQSGIFTSSIGQWRQELSPEEIFISQLIAKKEIQSLGYQLHNVSPNYLVVARYFLNTPSHLLRALKANKAYRGPTIPYLKDRIFHLIQSPNK